MRKNMETPFHGAQLQIVAICFSIQKRTHKDLSVCNATNSIALTAVFNGIRI